MSFQFGGCGTVDLKVRKNFDHPNMHPSTVAVLPFTLNGPTPEGVPVHKLFGNVSLTILVIWAMRMFL